MLHLLYFSLHADRLGQGVLQCIVDQLFIQLHGLVTRLVEMVSLSTSKNPSEQGKITKYYMIQLLLVNKKCFV